MVKPMLFTASLLALLAGFIMGIWPMNIDVLGMTVYSRPAPFILYGLIAEGRPAEETGQMFGSLAADMWDSIFYEALIRTAVAAFLTISGIGGAVSLGVAFLAEDRH